MAGKSKIYAISDNTNTITGLALAGISSHPAYTQEELRQSLENIAPDTALVIITSGLAEKCADTIEKFRSKNRSPLIVIIPDTE